MAEEIMEDTIYQGRTSLINYAGLLGLAALFILLSSPILVVPEVRGFGIVVMACGALMIAIAYLNVYATSFTVTSERVIQRKGLLSRRVSEVEIADIRNVQVNQGIVQRIFGIGNVGISTAGQAGVEIVFSGIKRPQPVADMIREQRKLSPE
jgi:uncharacterized membrane protein YdbT with pleckstrin-like domain